MATSVRRRDRGRYSILLVVVVLMSVLPVSTHTSDVVNLQQHVAYVKRLLLAGHLGPNPFRRSPVWALGGIRHGACVIRQADQPGTIPETEEGDCRCQANIRSCREAWKARTPVKHHLAGECQASPGTGHR